MRRPVLAVLSLALLAAPSAFAQQLVNVFVTGDNNGFSAAGATDSALDLQKSLASKKSLRVVNSPSEADLIVRIDSHDQRKELQGYTTNTNRSDDGKSTTKTTTANDTTIRTVHATLMAGDFTQALDADSTVGVALRSRQHCRTGRALGPRKLCPSDGTPHLRWKRCGSASATICGELCAASA